jgi:hypothetical protein
LARALPIAILGFCAVIAGCAESVPDKPTWDDDVRPLLVARCVRCHTDPGQVDPLSAKTGLDKLDGPAKPSFDFVYFSDAPAASLPFLKSLPMYIRGSASLSRMPPPPAAVLEDWEIETLTKFSNNLKAQ